ncbi:hypothetical protein Y1Q_0022075 [Alligator mississippiensis]|uniref:Uncharacterized protein n=1 Tax=Alligator mississippiensis TaxID=8496 RepID=A0A151NTC8_ALLMI|nr:hypothetical protein Y1Q_0022075 [Alligator mississippiensis]
MYCRLAGMVSFGRVMATQDSMGRSTCMVVGCHSKCRLSCCTNSWNVAQVIQKPLIIIPCGLDDVLPHILVGGGASLKAVSLKPQELMDSNHSNDHGSVSDILITFQIFLGLVASDPRTAGHKLDPAPGHMATCQSGVDSDETKVGQVVVTVTAECGECSDKQKLVLLVISAGTWVRSSHDGLGTDAGDSI